MMCMTESALMWRGEQKKKRFVYLFSLAGDVEAEDFTKFWEKKRLFYIIYMFLLKHMKHALKLDLEMVIVNANIIIQEDKTVKKRSMSVDTCCHVKVHMHFTYVLCSDWFLVPTPNQSSTADLHRR